MNNQEIILRAAGDDDKDQIAEVLLSFYNMTNYNEAAETFVSEVLRDFHYIVATENGKIIGLVTWLTHGLQKHGLIELDRICLLPESRGKGIGEKLVDKLISDAQEYYEKTDDVIRKLYLLTHEDNISAHAFYEKVGFTHETTLKNHYYNGKDERVYSMFFDIKNKA